jgi:exonuclease III
MKIATYNINNVRKRLPNLLAWLKAAKPDIVCLQELKSAKGRSPRPCRPAYSQSKAKSRRIAATTGSRA